MYGDLQVSIMTRQAEREHLEQRDAYLRRAGWYTLRAPAREGAWWRDAGGADWWGRVALALISRSLLPAVSLAGMWRRQVGDGRGQDGPPARACLPM